MHFYGCCFVPSQPTRLIGHEGFVNQWVGLQPPQGRSGLLRGRCIELTPKLVSLEGLGLIKDAGSQSEFANR